MLLSDEDAVTNACLCAETKSVTNNSTNNVFWLYMVMLQVMLQVMQRAAMQIFKNIHIRIESMEISST